MYLNLRTVLALAALVLILVAGGLAVANGAPLSDVGLPILLIVVLAAVIGARNILRHRAIEGELAYSELARASEARRAERSRAARRS